VLRSDIEECAKTKHKALRENYHKGREGNEFNKKRQAIGFVHQDKSHSHIPFICDRIGFERPKQYQDNYIGKTEPTGGGK